MKRIFCILLVALLASSFTAKAGKIVTDSVESRILGTEVKYNVYRSTTSSKPSSPLDTVSAATAYSDGNVAIGTTYYYWVAAVNSEGKEGTAAGPKSGTIDLSLTFDDSSFLFQGDRTMLYLNNAQHVVQENEEEQREQVRRVFVGVFAQ